MSRLSLTAIGGDLADAISISPDVDTEPSADDVVVAVEAAPINNGDLLFAAGQFSVYPDVPAPLGAEGMGRVVRAGANADPSLVDAGC